MRVAQLRESAGPIISRRGISAHEIQHTDREIDALVYELYDLSDQEIALVENATRNDD